ncbi:MAG TPA: DUF1194 domain-containing protein [Microvirga sp.]|jgi:hypothetical protein|nr:DUF1194 domain-containing protein [Microvirga sp.]
MVRVAALALCLALGWGVGHARAAEEVDLALVLAVDVSRSMDPDEQELQRQGFVEAFRSPVVHEAIRGGMLGRITVTYMEWSGSSDQKVVVPWTILDGPGSAIAFADRLAEAPIGRIFQTSISGAIDFSAKLLEQTGAEPLRKVVDVSGDGPNSSGRSPALARDEAVAKGITINGLPIMLKRPTGFGDMENLDHYYRDCVIGGPGAFLVPVRERQNFADAIKTKILREIVGMPPDATIQYAQAEARIDCFARQGRGFNYGP